MLEKHFECLNWYVEVLSQLQFDAFCIIDFYSMYLPVLLEVKARGCLPGLLWLNQPVGKQPLHMLETYEALTS
jgi:hypothetical protein